MAGTITALKVQKRNRNRVNVYLDERYGFGLAGHLAVPLRRGQFLSDKEIARLKEKDEYHQVVKDAKTGKVIHEEHQRLSEHHQQGKERKGIFLRNQRHSEGRQSTPTKHNLHPLTFFICHY